MFKTHNINNFKPAIVNSLNTQGKVTDIKVDETDSQYTITYNMKLIPKDHNTNKPLVTGDTSAYIESYTVTMPKHFETEVDEWLRQIH